MADGPAPLHLLERALRAEERAEELTARVEELEGRMRGILKAEPTTATRAFGWMSRAELAETLLRELTKHRLSAEDKALLPPGWLARAESQLKSVEILKRDQKEMAERPDVDEEWEELIVKDIEGGPVSEALIRIVDKKVKERAGRSLYNPPPPIRTEHPTHVGPTGLRYAVPMNGVPLEYVKSEWQ